MTILDLFSGIGGFSLGFESANFKNYDFKKLPEEQTDKNDNFFKTVAFCEIDENCRKVLKKHYPNTPIFKDVKDLNGLSGVDIITGGFPCQDLSVAGKHKGLEGSRSGLFYEMCRIIKECKPKYVLFENTPKLIRNKTYHKLFAKELGICGYEYRAFLLRADAFGYAHKRQRAYIIAYPAKKRFADIENLFDFLPDEKQRAEIKTPKEIISVYRRYIWRNKNGYENDLRDIRNDDGFSENVERIGMLGNAVIPKIVSCFAKYIKETKIYGDKKWISYL